MAFSNASGKFYVCETPQPSTLTQAQYERLKWVEVTGIGSLPESGTQENVITYDTIDQDTSDKSKGIANAGDGTLEVSYDATDTGQIALRAMAATTYKYATARVIPDAPNSSTTNSVLYNRGVIGGPVMAGGRNEDFVVETYQFGYGPQKEIKVAPTTGTVPTNVSVPTISGTAAVAETLTATTGTWQSCDPGVTYAYVWKADGVAISGETASTLVLTSDEVGTVITVEVTATNAFGNSTAAASAATSAVS